MPLEDVHQVKSTNWKLVIVAIAIILFSGAASLIPFPYGWLIGSALGIALLFLGMRLQTNPLVKDFSRPVAERVAMGERLEIKHVKTANGMHPYEVTWVNEKTGQRFSEFFQDFTSEVLAIPARFKNQKEATYPTLTVRVEHVEELATA